jgi:hypothetical protein
LAGNPDAKLCSEYIFECSKPQPSQNRENIESIRDTLEHMFVLPGHRGYSFDCLEFTQPGTTDIRAGRMRQAGQEGDDSVE